MQLRDRSPDHAARQRREFSYTSERRYRLMVGGVVGALCWAILVSWVSVPAGAGASSHSAVDRQILAPAPVNLIIWAKKASTMTGSSMVVSIDGGEGEVISNLDEQMLVDLGSYEPGIHNFVLSDIVGYMIDQDGASQRVTSGGGKCAGQFYVSSFQKYYFLGVNTPDGMNFQCGSQ